jgi:RND family efflux transporter MFP subunit
VNKIFRTLAPLVVIAIGVFVAWVLFVTRPRPEKAEAPVVPTRVQIEPVVLEDRPIRVSAMGTVIAAQQVELRPQVSGRVVGYHPQLMPGGLVEAGETLVRIDARDYRLALEDAEAALEKARFDAELERGRQKVARREFELLRSDKERLGEEEYALALRKPHLRNVEAALEAAESRVQRARLEIARTTVEAPFNAIVQSESVDVGQLVNNQTTLASLVGTDAFWVQVSVPVSALEWIRADPADGSSVEVRHARGRAAPIVKPGRAVRLLGDLDPRGRMARLLVRVDDPLDLDRPPDARQPLLLGAYVRATIEGRSADRVAVIPRVALREGDRVWLMNEDDVLEIRPVSTTFRGRDEVYVASGLEEGDRVVVSRIAAPVPGMTLKLQSTTDDVESTARIGG